MPELNDEIKKHNVYLKSRAHMELDGVLEVLSFDDVSVSLETVMGEMIIEGEELRVSSLDTDKGIVVLDGKINGMYYNTDSQKEKRRFFGGLLGK